jgi:UDP-glucose:(glucosyl)LPS alpha-1,3-glucosyltransferase
MCGFAHNSYQGLSLDATSSNDPVAFVTANPDAIHVAFGVDANYFRGMGVTITSVVKNNPDLQFVFHVFAFFVSEDSRHRLNQLEKKYGVTINVHLLSTDLLKEFAEFPCFAHHSLGTFIRLLIPNKLQGITKKVLYLDADILCFGSITELLSTDIDDCIAAVVHDEVETTAKTQIAALEIRHGQYFNAGVMYINVGNWIASDTQNAALRILSSQELVFADQDALNIALDGRTKYIEEKWNFRYHLVDFLDRGDIRLNVAEPFVFMHFTGPVKPWHDWCLHEAKTIFVQYQSLSSWFDVPLDRPKTSRELKLFSKFLIKQNRIGDGICWHLKYLGVRFAQSLKFSGFSDDNATTRLS